MNAEPNRFFKSSSPKKVINPPGGKTNDIFNTSPCQTEVSQRRVRDTMKSSVFDTTDNGYQRQQSAISARPTRNGSDAGDDEKSASPKRFENTKDRLFGENGGDVTNRRCRLSDTSRSTVFQGDSGEPLTVNTPKKKISNGSNVNPITGTPLQKDLGNTNGHSNGDLNGNVVIIGNGHTNGTNVNGHHDLISPVSNGKVFRRPPPGGFSSGIF